MANEAGALLPATLSIERELGAARVTGNPRLHLLDRALRWPPARHV